MNKNSKLITIVIILGIGLTLSIPFLNHSKKGSLSSFVNEEGFDFQTNHNYSVDEIDKNKVAGIPLKEIEASSESKKASVQIYSNVDSQFASNYIKDRREQIAAIYTDAPAPYEGVPAREVNCPKKFIPDLGGNSTNKEDFNLYSNSENEIGACSNSSIEYHTKISLLYCSKSNKLISIKISQPVEADKVKSVISCE